jgi:hypothetical protein
MRPTTRPKQLQQTLYRDGRVQPRQCRLVEPLREKVFRREEGVTLGEMGRRK